MLEKFGANVLKSVVDQDLQMSKGGGKGGGHLDLR